MAERYYDAVVIGGGVLGCFAARNLCRYKVSTLVLEAREDICTGITRANSAIVYPGYDNKTGSLKAALTVRGNLDMEALCRELEVPFSRCGSLLVTYDSEAVPRIEKKLRQGQRNGVPGLKQLSGEEAEAMEPMLKKGVAAALYVPTTATVNPWQLGIAAWENARANGAELRTNAPVTAIEKTEEGYLVLAGEETVRCRLVINCAGLFADRVQALIAPTPVTLLLDGAEYMVMDEDAEKPQRVIFLQAAACGKGITAIPCVEGNLLISGSRKELRTHFATTPEGLAQLRQDTRDLLPEIDLSRVIRSFGAVRPNPKTENGDNVSDFCVENPLPGFYSLIGVKTPGLTCANGLGLHVARLAAEYLGAEENPSFDPRRKAIPPYPGEIVCQCGSITRGQILEAIRRGAVTVDGVKRRIGTGMGACQGSRCRREIEKLLKEYGNGAL